MGSADEDESRDDKDDTTGDQELSHLEMKLPAHHHSWWPPEWLMSSRRGLSPGWEARMLRE